MGMFDELKDVEAREEVHQEKSDIEKILDTEKEIIERFKSDERTQDHYKVRELYPLIYGSVEEKSKKITITREIVQSYINARDNLETDSSAILRGMYSAALLELSCKKEPDKKITINGNGKVFNYLFHYIKNVSNVVIQNFKGKEILRYAGLAGKIKHITCRDIEGDELLSRAAQYNGVAEHINCINIKGDNTLYSIGYKGKIEYILCENIAGSRTLGNASGRGNAKYIICRNITGSATLAFVGSEGSVQHISCINITGDSTLEGTGQYHKSAKYLTLENVEGNRTLYNGGGDGGINHIIIDQPSEKNALHTDLHFERRIKNVLQEHERTAKQRKQIEEIIKIAENMSLDSFEEQKAAHEKIAELQKEVFRKKWQKPFISLFETTKKLLRREKKRGKT